VKTFQPYDKAMEVNDETRKGGAALIVACHRAARKSKGHGRRRTGRRNGASFPLQPMFFQRLRRLLEGICVEGDRVPGAGFFSFRLGLSQVFWPHDGGPVFPHIIWSQLYSPIVASFAFLGAVVTLKADADRLPTVVPPALQFVQVLARRQSGQSQLVRVIGTTRYLVPPPGASPADFRLVSSKTLTIWYAFML